MARFHQQLVGRSVLQLNGPPSPPPRPGASNPRRRRRAAAAVSTAHRSPDATRPSGPTQGPGSRAVAAPLAAAAVAAAATVTTRSGAGPETPPLRGPGLQWGRGRGSPTAAGVCGEHRLVEARTLRPAVQAWRAQLSSGPGSGADPGLRQAHPRERPAGGPPPPPTRPAAGCAKGPPGEAPERSSRRCVLRRPRRPAGHYSSRQAARRRNRELEPHGRAD